MSLPAGEEYFQTIRAVWLNNLLLPACRWILAVRKLILEAIICKKYECWQLLSSLQIDLKGKEIFFLYGRDISITGIYFWFFIMDYFGKTLFAQIVLFEGT